MHFKGPKIRLKLNVSGFLTTFLAVLIISITPSFAEQPQLAPVNPEFIQHFNNALKSQTQSKLMLEGVQNSRPLKLTPSPLDRSHMTGLSVTPPQHHLMKTGVMLMGTPPASYDLRTLGRVTPVKDQGQCGSCWTFATMGSLESAQLPSGTFDFSEHNLNDLSGFDVPPCQGGNSEMSAAYLARWSGPIAESADPYSATNMTSPAGLSPSTHVQDIMNIPDRANSLDNNNIKVALQTYGALYTTMYWTNASYNSTTSSYYYNGSPAGNHAVTIVGWDDNYDKSKFTTAPAGNGAFLVKNSWGTAWGQQGYFYASYYDTSFGRGTVAFLDAEPTTNYSKTYQYDNLGWVTSNGYGNTTAWFANIFTATASEPLSAVSIQAASPNSPYTIYVYTNVTGGPTTGTLAGSTSGTAVYAGYTTIPLSSPVSLTNGQKFAVVVQLTTPGYNWPIPISAPYSGYSSKATNKTGQSYMSSNGASWTDVASTYANTSVCLKAFTTASTTPGTCTFTITPSQTTTFAATASSASVAVTAQTGCIWTATKTMDWVTIVSGTSGSGNGTVSFTVAANTGTASRSGNMTIAGKTYAVTQNGATVPCSYLINPAASPLLNYSGATASISVITQPGCQWTATKSLDWISISSGTSGTGNGTVNVAVSANTLPGSRTGYVTIAGKSYLVAQQAAPTCSYSVTPTGATIPQAGSSGTFAVTTQASCAWSINASVQAPFITVTSSKTGIGNGTVSYTVSANTSPSSRSGLVALIGSNGSPAYFTATQGGKPVCTYAVTPRSPGSFPGSGGTLNLDVTTQAGCTWTAASGLSWISIASGASGTGSGTVAIKAPANTSMTSRTGNIAVAGQSYSVVQSGACSYTINPQNASDISSSGGTGTISVTTQSGCQWTVTNPLSWVTITSGSTATGSGTVQYKVSANSSASRAGVMTIASQPFTMSQRATTASSCTYSFTLSSTSMLPYPQNAPSGTPLTWPAAGGTAVINVQTQSGCPWNATSGQSWMTVTPSPASGGSGTVTYTLAPNTGLTNRTGTWTITAGTTGTLTVPIQENSLSTKK